MTIRDLPAVNATLNGTAAVLLLGGRYFIAKRQIQTHKKFMIAAFCVSIAFLICYLIYHSQVGSVPFRKPGPIRWVYFSILISHTLLAVTVPVLAVLSLRRGLSGRFAAHVAISRWTYPVWLYVSVTGVIVYLMLYKL